MALSPLFPQLWSARITYFAQQHSAFLPNATRQWEGEAVYGNTIKVPTIDRNVTLHDYNRTADLNAPEDIDATTQDLVIDQEKYFNFALEDLDARQSRIPGASLIDLKSQGAALKIASTIDAYVASTLGNIPAGERLFSASSAAAFDLDFIAEVKKRATLNGLLQRSLVIVTTPEFVEGIEKGIIDKTWGDAVTGRLAPIGRRGAASDPGAVENGLAMTLGGLPVYVTNSIVMRKTAQLAVPTGGSRGAVSGVWVYNPLDLALVMQVNKVESYRQEKRFGTGVKGLVNYGTKALNHGRIMFYMFNDVT